jgi:uroporphyrin-III C-methyltransferase / precorrin-2 dehydrogenase / sirohydrochlorin ferrochelatase
MLPVNLNVTGREVLIVGGGAVAARRARALADARARVTVVAPRAVASLAEGSRAQRWRWHARSYTESDLSGCFLATVAVDDTTLGDAIYAACQARGVLCNVADQPSACDFHFPALIRRGELAVAISTDGAAPALARTLREQLDRVLDPSLGAFLDVLRGARRRVRDRIARHEDRARVMHALTCDLSARARIARGGAFDSDAWVDEALTHLDAPTAPAPRVDAVRGQLAIVGAGPGRPDWITLRGAELIDRADALLYDALVHPELLARARAGCLSYFVGRRAGQAQVTREAVGRMMVELAARGLHVVRLKGGDPNVFAGGAEELGAIQALGAKVEIVPGITAAFGVAASLGLPLTFRRVASSLHLVSGHVSPDEDEDGKIDWETLARVDGTLVLYMASRNLSAITKALIAYGRPPDTPAVAVYNGSLPDARAVHGTLATIADDVASAELGMPLLVFLGVAVAPAGITSP